MNTRCLPLYYALRPTEKLLRAALRCNFRGGSGPQAAVRPRQASSPSRPRRSMGASRSTRKPQLLDRGFFLRGLDQDAAPDGRPEGSKASSRSRPPPISTDFSFLAPARPRAHHPRPTRDAVCRTRTHRARRTKPRTRRASFIEQRSSRHANQQTLRRQDRRADASVMAYLDSVSRACASQRPNREARATRWVGKTFQSPPRRPEDGEGKESVTSAHGLRRGGLARTNWPDRLHAESSPRHLGNSSMFGTADGGRARPAPSRSPSGE